MPKLIHGPYDRPYSPFGAKDVHVLQVLTWGETGHRWVTMTHGRHISSNSWMGSTFEVRRAGRSKRFLAAVPMRLNTDDTETVVLLPDGGGDSGDFKTLAPSALLRVVKIPYFLVALLPSVRCE
mmetsp:Transcript_25437/g.55636  ORF Transcript_25437/g.55636 Transcript_25437/m.55636 type:complete len:124 (-) Transcript_25437:1110-1481(-)